MYPSSFKNDSSALGRDRINKGGVKVRLVNKPLSSREDLDR